MTDSQEQVSKEDPSPDQEEDVTGAETSVLETVLDFLSTVIEVMVALFQHSDN